MSDEANFGYLARECAEAVPANLSGIRPVEYKVLVRPDKVEERTKGGLYMPDTTAEKEQFAVTMGVLVAKSPQAFTDLPDVAVGARVVFDRYAAKKVTGRDGAEYWIMKDSNIAAEMK